MHAGIVDLASFNIMNAVIGAGSAPASDWLLLAMTPEATTLAIGRGGDLMFYRHRAAVEPGEAPAAKDVLDVRSPGDRRCWCLDDCHLR